MNKINLSQIKPISSLPRDYNSLAKQAKQKGEVVFLKRNKPYLVLMDFEHWQNLTEIKRKLEEQQALATINKSEQEYRAGKAKKLKSLSEL